jgi:hypothetical protein
LSRSSTSIVGAASPRKRAEPLRGGTDIDFGVLFDNVWQPVA